MDIAAKLKKNSDPIKGRLTSLYNLCTCKKALDVTTHFILAIASYKLMESGLNEITVQNTEYALLSSGKAATGAFNYFRNGLQLTFLAQSSNANLNKNQVISNRVSALGNAPQMLCSSQLADKVAAFIACSVYEIRARYYKPSKHEKRPTGKLTALCKKHFGKVPGATTIVRGGIQTISEPLVGPLQTLAGAVMFYSDAKKKQAQPVQSQTPLLAPQ